MNKTDENRYTMYHRLNNVVPFTDYRFNIKRLLICCYDNFTPPFRYQLQNDCDE